MLIDKYLQKFHYNEHHSIAILSSRSCISTALENLDLSQSGIIRFLFWIRGLPTKNISIESLGRSRFTELERRQNDEVVIGLIGQFWKPDGNLQKFEPSQFIEFNKSNFLKAVWNFKIDDLENHSCSLSTETRIYCTDENSRRRFSRYWFFIKPFSGLIRMEMLRAIKKSAEAKHLLTTVG